MGYQFNPITGKLDLVGSGGGAPQVNSDWNATSGAAQILNKPFLSSANLTLSSDAGYSNATIAAGYASLAFSVFDGDSVNATPLVLTTTSASFAVPVTSATQTITAAANTSALTASYSVTGTNTTPLLNLSGTWNTTGVARGILLNVTDTASNASSLLFDLRRGGSSVFNVSKFGVLTCGQIVTNSNQISCGQINIAGSSQINWNFDTIMQRDGVANTLALRNGTAANTLRVYGTFTDSNNGRRLDITSTTGGVFTLTATGNGTGATGNLLKLTAPVLIPASSVTLATNGDLAFEATSNTSLTIRYRGTDGTTRSASLTLA